MNEIVVCPPNKVRGDFLAYQSDTAAWGLGLTEGAALAQLEEHPRFRPVTDEAEDEE